jgi:hypothetical protein
MGFLEKTCWETGKFALILAIAGFHKIQRELNVEFQNVCVADERIPPRLLFLDS